MKTFKKTALSLETAALAIALGGMGYSTSAYAQDTTAAPAPAAECADSDANGVCDADEKGQQIVVTGSRIKRPNLDSTQPITSVAGDSFFQQGQNNVGDALNDLPQLRSTFAQQNPGLGIGIAGLSLLDLRGLGTQRTLVLVNGRRHVAADILNNAVSPDIGSFPASLIERVDIVTGGDSAIYGSDAIAGVVNFVLKQNFSGIEVRGQGGVTQRGFGGNETVSATFGKNFADGRGNIAVAAEFTHADRVYASDVPFFRSNDNYATIDSDGGAGIVNGGDGFPDTQFFNDIRSSTIYFGGLIPISQRNFPNAGLCGNATSPNNGGPNTAGAAFNCTYIFTPDGRLVQQTGSRVGGTGINPIFVGGNGQTGREGKTVSVLPFLERLNLNLIGHYEFSPAATFFVEAKWARLTALGNNAGPSFIQTGAGNNGNIGDFRERVRIDNPFLNPADRTTLANLILASSCNPSLVTVCPQTTNIGTVANPNIIPGNLTPTDQANIANGSYRFNVARNLLDVGLRDEHFQRDTWRVVGGLKGSFNSDWSYEVSLNYGQFNENVVTNGFIDRQRFSLAMDAGRDPATGTIKCRSQFDPASAVPDARTDAVAVANRSANAARLAADIAACVPYNPFGQADNSASVAYFARTFTAKSSLTQFVASAFVSGDSSGFFNFQGGPIGFAVGGEYRKETARYEQDPFTTAGFTNGVSIPAFIPSPFEVREAYTELRLPILKDLPFFQELTFNGAARYASYKGGAGSQWSYNFGADYAPVEDIRFRANYSRAVRAPNVSETGFPLVPNFSNGFVDPCNVNSIGTGVRAANCLADLGAIPASNIRTGAYSLPIVSGSNPNLNAETGISYTYGVVLKPRFIPGMSLSVDYYNIRVKGVIASIGVQTLVNQCYDSPTLNNVFCSAFQRFRGPGVGPLGEAPGEILGNSLISAPLNFAARTRRGIDVNFNYTHRFNSSLALDSSLVYVHTLTSSNYQDPTLPNLETRVVGQLGDPKDEFRWDWNLSVGKVTFGYRMHYIGPMYLTAYGNLFPINGLPPQNIDAFPVQQLPSVWYHDLRLDFDVSKAYKFYLGVDNVTDTKVPPGATTATGAGSAIYSFRGRNLYAGFRARF